MKQWTIDAFAVAPFKGNPACVVEPFDQWPEAAWMQALAKENNQAETAFLLRTDDPARFGLRWFTPGMEVDLCGHATLASAHVLLAEVKLKADALTFDTRSGPLIVRASGDGYEMDFPADPPRRTGVVPGLAEALGVEPLEVWAGRYLVAVLADATAVYAVTPGCGVDEDPATGSAHCILAPLYADKLGRAEVRFRQVFPGRGGDIGTVLNGDRVLLRGRAVTVIESALRL
jgi:predicted PhzF superfamily epimerase YddE/YHI9